MLTFSQLLTTTQLGSDGEKSSFMEIILTMFILIQNVNQMQVQEGSFNSLHDERPSRLP